MREIIFICVVPKITEIFDSNPLVSRSSSSCLHLLSLNVLHVYAFEIVPICDLMRLERGRVVVRSWSGVDAPLVKNQVYSMHIVYTCILATWYICNFNPFIADRDKSSILLYTAWNQVRSRVTRASHP